MDSERKFVCPILYRIIYQIDNHCKEVRIIYVIIIYTIKKVPYPNIFKPPSSVNQNTTKSKEGFCLCVMFATDSLPLPLIRFHEIVYRKVEKALEFCVRDGGRLGDSRCCVDL